MNDSGTTVNEVYYITMDDTSIGLEPILFPGFDPDLGTLLVVIYLLMAYIAEFLAGLPSYILYGLIVFTNSIHTIVLLRKPIRSLAINIILASIAIINICTVLAKIVAIVADIGPWTLLPSPDPDEIYLPIVNFKNLFVTIVLRRNAAYLPILLPVIRILVIKKFYNLRYAILSTAKFGICAVSFIIAVISIFTLMSFVMLTCQKSSDMPQYYKTNLDFLSSHESISTFVNFVLPSLFYPILAFILHREVKKENSRVREKPLEEGKSADHTSKLVFLITVCYMIAEAPQAIGGGMKLFYGTNMGVFYMGQYIMDIFSTIFMLNDSAHFFMCFILLPNYKTEFRKIFKIPRKTNKLSDLATAAMKYGRKDS